MSYSAPTEGVKHPMLEGSQAGSGQGSPGLEACQRLIMPDRYIALHARFCNGSNGFDRLHANIAEKCQTKLRQRRRKCPCKACHDSDEGLEENRKVPDVDVNDCVVQEFTVVQASHLDALDLNAVASGGRVQCFATLQESDNSALQRPTQNRARIAR